MGHFDERALAELAARTYTYRMLHIVFGSEPTEQELALLGGEATAAACAALTFAGYSEAALLTSAVSPFADRLETGLCGRAARPVRPSVHGARRGVREALGIGVRYG